MSQPCVTTQDIADALSLSIFATRAFKKVSAPPGLPFETIAPPSGGKNQRRAYHADAVWRWIERAAPHRATSDAKRRLEALASQHAEATA